MRTAHPGRQQAQRKSHRLPLLLHFARHQRRFSQHLTFFPMPGVTPLIALRTSREVGFFRIGPGFCVCCSVPGTPGCPGLRPDGSYWPQNSRGQASLLSELRHSLVKSWLARKCLPGAAGALGVRRPSYQPVCRPTPTRASAARHLQAIPCLEAPVLQRNDRRGAIRRPEPSRWPQACDVLSDRVQPIPWGQAAWGDLCRVVRQRSGQAQSQEGQREGQRDEHRRELAEKSTGKWVSGEP